LIIIDLLELILISVKIFNLVLEKSALVWLALVDSTDASKALILVL
jgi:hypothetical protein